MSTQTTTKRYANSTQGEVIVDYLRTRRNLINISNLERIVGCPYGTIRHCINGTQPLPDKWIVPITRTLYATLHHWTLALYEPVNKDSSIDDTLSSVRITCELEHLSTFDNNQSVYLIHTPNVLSLQQWDLYTEIIRNMPFIRDKSTPVDRIEKRIQILVNRDFVSTDMIALLVDKIDSLLKEESNA